MNPLLRRLIAAAVVCTLWAVVPDVASARVHALAIGINDYKTIKKLEGAVADAQDVAQALRSVGATVTLLTDKEATRKRIERAWREIVGSAAAGDVVVFFYAGHGGQEPDREPFDEEDGKDEAFLLAGFSTKKGDPGFSERLVDDEIHGWLKEAVSKGFKVIFVADSCHSGGAGRATFGGGQVRFVPPYGEEEGASIAQAVNASPKQDAVEGGRDRDIPGVFQFLAVSEKNQSPEVRIDGERRGALSYAFSRAIEGQADADRDGMLSGLELQTFLIPQVALWSEGRQIPDFVPLRQSGDGLLPAGKATATGAGLHALPPLSLNIESGGATASANLRLDNATIVAAQRDADLIWNEADGTVRSSTGDIVAEGVRFEELSQIVEKWRVLGMLKRVSAGHAIEVNLSGGTNKTYRTGEEFRLESETLPSGSYVTVFDLAPDGSVAFLHPDKTRRSLADSEASRWPDDIPFFIPRIRVEAPYGADHIVVLASDKPVDGLYKAASAVSSATLTGLLAQVLDGATFRIGVVGIYTRAE